MPTRKKWQRIYKLRCDCPAEKMCSFNISNTFCCCSFQVGRHRPLRIANAEFFAHCYASIKAAHCHYMVGDTRRSHLAAIVRNFFFSSLSRNLSYAVRNVLLFCIIDLRIWVYLFYFFRFAFELLNPKPRRQTVGVLHSANYLWM